MVFQDFSEARRIEPFPRPSARSDFARTPLIVKNFAGGCADMLKLGTLGIDGTKIHANASRHSALSYEHAGKIEAQLKAEVAELMAKAEAADKADIPDGMSIPDELARREDRLQKIAEARTKIE